MLYARTHNQADHTCPGCHGYGASPCGPCDGTGVVTVGASLAAGEAGEERPCKECRGSGAASCPMCHGKGTRGPLAASRFI